MLKQQNKSPNIFSYVKNVDKSGK